VFNSVSNSSIIHLWGVLFTQCECVVCQACSFAEACFGSVDGAAAEPPDLGHADSSVAEEEQHRVQLNEAEEQRPDVAALHQREPQREQDRGNKCDRSVEVLVNEEVFDVAAGALKERETGQERDHGECEHEHKFVGRGHDHGQHDEAEEAEKASHDEGDDGVGVTLLVAKAVEDAEPALGFGLGPA